jgi:hypothetical protein
MGTVAAIALGGYAIGVPTEAKAVDSVTWSWEQSILENVNKNVTINISIDPVGMVDDEIMQIQIGDVNAYSSVSGVYNWKPLTEQVVAVQGTENEKKLTIDGSYNYDLSGHHGYGSTTKTSNSTTTSFDGNLHGDLTTHGSDHFPLFIGGAGAIGGFFTDPGPDGAAGAGVIGAIGAYGTNGHADFNGNLGGSLTTGVDTESSQSTRNWYSAKGEGTFGGNLDVTYADITRIYGLAPAVQDAKKELPVVTSDAVAVGNSISIETDTAVQEHSLQVVADTTCGGHRGDGNMIEVRDGRGCRTDFNDAAFKLDAGFYVNGNPVEVDTNVRDGDAGQGNYFHDVALLTTLSAGAGLLKKADISATSTVSDILNASVEGSATAIGNIKSISVDTGVDQNGLVIGDISQVSVADVSAYSTVGGGYAIPVLASSVECIDCGGYPNAGGINIINYTGLGGKNIAASTATAIGNAVNIKVNSGQGPAQ